MSGQLRVGVPFVQLMHRYRAIAPRPLHGEPVKTEDSSKTPQGSGSDCSGRNTPQFEGPGKQAKLGLKRRAVLEAPLPSKRLKRGDAQVAAMAPFELPSPISLPKTQPGRCVAGPVETKNYRYMLNCPPQPFSTAGAHLAQAPFPPPTYPTSSLSRYQSSTTGPSLPLQHFPPYSQVTGGTVLGVPVSRSLSEQVVPTNYFPPHQQRSSPCPSEGAVTTGGFSTPPLLKVAPQAVCGKTKGEKEKERGPLKPRGLVPIAPKSEPPQQAPIPSGGVHSAPRSTGGFRMFSAKAPPQPWPPRGFARPPAVPPGSSKVIRAWPMKQEPASVVSPFGRIGPFAESKSLGSGGSGSGFRQFCRAETKRGEPAPAGKAAEFPAHGGQSHNPAVLDSRYLEQLYGAFVEPVMVTDREHKLLWSNAAFQRVADENQGGGPANGSGNQASDSAPSSKQDLKSTGEINAEGNLSRKNDLRAGSGFQTSDASSESGLGAQSESALRTDPVTRSASAFQKDPESKSGVTVGSVQPGMNAPGSEAPRSPGSGLSNKGAIPVPISSIQYQGPSETPSCPAILWVFLKQPGFVVSAAPTPNPATPNPVVADAEACSPLNGPPDVSSKENDSSSGSSSSTGSLATATSQGRRRAAWGGLPGENAPSESKSPGRVVTPQPLRPAGSRIRFEAIEPLASNASLAVKGSFEMIKRQFDQWSSPVILTDLKNRARWVNAAYKKLVGQPPSLWSGDGSNLEHLRLTGGINVAGLEALKTLPPSLKCMATVSWLQGEGGRPLESCCMGTRIDSVGSEVLGYLWRFGTPLRGQSSAGAGDSTQGNTSE